jgi:hypothetical protein
MPALFEGGLAVVFGRPVAYAALTASTTRCRPTGHPSGPNVGGGLGSASQPQPALKPAGPIAVTARPSSKYGVISSSWLPATSPLQLPGLDERGDQRFAVVGSLPQALRGVQEVCCARRRGGP